MDIEEFLTEHVKPGKEFIAGLVSIDIVDHSKLKGTSREKADTKTALGCLIASQLMDAPAALLPWRGDGGTAVFDISNGCNELLMFADRIRQLIPLFNRARGVYNELPHGQEIIVRIVCHAGTLINQDGNPGNLSGDALNLLAKREKDIGHPGYVVMTLAVYERLSVEFQERCQFACEHPDFGKVYVLDGKLAFSPVWYNDRRSNELKAWITDTCAQRTYDRLLYFAYTNELLYDYLGYELEGLEVRILARNWVVERREEELFNEGLRAGGTAEAEQTRRLWFKSSEIELRAKEIVEGSRERGRPINIRFYDAPPLFNGAILISNTDVPSAFIGMSRWEEDPIEGGSPYKLEEWPAIVLDGRDGIQASLIAALESRFEQIWNHSLTYEEVREHDANQKAMHPVIIGKIWKLDEHPYLIVYPQRRLAGRAFLVVAHEDVMAFHLLERFLNECGAKVELLTFQLPDGLVGDWFPTEVETAIEEWDGHVVYVCTKSISPALQAHLLDEGFPYELHGVGTESPHVLHRTKELRLESPTDRDPPEARDYSIIAKFNRQGRDTMAYIVAGIRAMGTWGAAHYLADRHNVQALVPFVGDNQFAAIVETTFDPEKYQVTGSKLYIIPEAF